MKKTILGLLLLCVSAVLFSKSNVETNWNGWNDTVAITDSCPTGVIRYTGGFTFSSVDKVRLGIMVNDTGHAGFASDSVSLIWGYQGFHQVRNGSGLTDTIYEQRQVLDTIKTTSFGTFATGIVPATGVSSYTFGQVDTSNVTGYAVQERTFSPGFNVYIRFFVVALAANRQPLRNKIRMVYTYRAWAPVQAR
jgi:hypothetical protein